MIQAAAAEGWSWRHGAALATVFGVGIVIRILLLPTTGLRDDLDQFAGWTHLIATDGLATLYDPNPFGPVTFGPVMGYVWAGLAVLQPAFQSATEAMDPTIRVALKSPALLADLGIAALMSLWLSERPWWAVVAAAAFLLHPAVLDLGAWWGQYDSVYVLPGLAATILAARGHNVPAGALLAIAVLTKPQAVAFIVPLAAWIWATGGWRGLALATVAGTLIATILWAPFLAAGGPASYLGNIAAYQSDIFAILSIRAWNVWWLVQEAVAGGQFVGDGVALAGRLTLRDVGYAAAGLLEVVVAVSILRSPRRQTLILGMAASVLVVFMFMTQMHERYAFAALVFLGLLIPDARARVVAAGFGLVFTLNLLAAIPPTTVIREVLPVSGPLGVIGSLAMLLITARVLGWTARGGFVPVAPPPRPAQ